MMGDIILYLSPFDKFFAEKESFNHSPLFIGRKYCISHALQPLQRKRFLCCLYFYHRFPHYLTQKLSINS